MQALSVALFSQQVHECAELTYCSFLCELGDLGFSMQGLEHMERAPKAEAAPEAPEAPAGELAPSAAII